MKKKAWLNILGSFACVIASVFLAVLGIIVPFYYAITAFTAPKTVVQVVQNVDYKTVIEQSPDIKTALEEFGVDSSTADEYMKSDEAGEIIEVYADEATEIILNIPDDKAFDIPLLKELVDENLDEFITLAEKTLGKQLPEKTIKRSVDSYIKNNEPQIKEVIPVIEETRTVVKTVMASTVLRKTLTPLVAAGFFATSAVFASIIFIIKRKYGLLWLGIDFTAVSLILSLVLAFSRSDIVSNAALKLSHFETEIIESAISVCGDKMFIALCGTAALTVLFLGIFVVMLMSKREDGERCIHENKGCGL